MAPIPGSVARDRRGRVAVLTVDSPPGNALGHRVREGLRDAVMAASQDDAVGAIVIAGAGPVCLGGGDPSEFAKPPQPAGLHEVIALIEDAAKPVIAALHGTMIHAGLEVALACHFRVSARTARFGVFAAKLGLLPGAGGTQRFPRLVGVEQALQMMVTGETIGADEARRHGLVDEIVEGDLAAAAVAFAERVVSAGGPPRRTRDLEDRLQAVRGKPDVFTAFRASVAGQTRGLRAPEACIEAVQAALTLSFEDGLARERELFLELLDSPESRAQRYITVAEREAAHIPDVPADTPAREIRTAAVIGAGTMGGGIAMGFADAGIAVTVVEVSKDALDRGLGVVRKNYETTAARGRLTARDIEIRMGLITGTTDFGAVAEADIVIEAVFEEMGLKREVFARLDGIAKADAVLATNTSTLDVDEIAAATRRPESVIGTHFVSPANAMPLLENVRGARSSKTTIATAMAIGQRLGRVPVLVGVCHGFVGNRMRHQRDQEAETLILEGALPEQVDRVLYDFGFPMGPFAMDDLAGLDVGWRIRKGRGETSVVADRLCEMGRFGHKTGAGYYTYGSDRQAAPDPEVEEIIGDVSTRLGFRRRPISDAEIRERLLYPIVNEGAKILEEKIAVRASDIDVIWAHGYGWPVYRGGPMFWADFDQGLPALRDRMLAYGQRLGAEHSKPTALLSQLADRGRTFTAYHPTMTYEGLYGPSVRRS